MQYNSTAIFFFISFFYIQSIRLIFKQIYEFMNIHIWYIYIYDEFVDDAI